ncbi:hypothetical protein RYZ26_01295, partial [Terasakiella sp. A23]|uniref:hypothetical protein n=1 Tax=Terasakiella sp. FCG-A23 TaxID=3080561 RepID=UPI0029555F0A
QITHRLLLIKRSLESHSTQFVNPLCQQDLGDTFIAFIVAPAIASVIAISYLLFIGHFIYDYSVAGLLLITPFFYPFFLIITLAVGLLPYLFLRLLRITNLYALIIVGALLGVYIESGFQDSGLVPFKNYETCVLGGVTSYIVWLLTIRETNWFKI